MRVSPNFADHDAALRAQLRLFCDLMLGSTDAADRAMQHIYRRAPDIHDEQQDWPSERIRLFRIAAEFCGVCPVANPAGHRATELPHPRVPGRPAPTVDGRTPP